MVHLRFYLYFTVLLFFPLTISCLLQMDEEHSRSAASDSYNEDDEDFVNDDAFDDEGE